jgi:DNA-binding SARP family transcriptional activator
MAADTDPESLELRLFGHLQVRRGGRDVVIPASRKTRAILGYLTLMQRPISRQCLCELFFEVPDDPRAALRWSLSKLRPLLDSTGKRRLVADRDTVRIDLGGADVDALHAADLLGRDPASLDSAERSDALGRMSGELLEDADLPDRPE